MAFKKLGFTIIVTLLFLSCSKDVSSDGYKLIYIDNNGKCIPCIQMRKISEDVIDERFSEIKDSLNISFEKVSVRSVRYEELRNKAKAYVKSLVVIKIKNGKEVNYKLVDTGLMFLSLNRPEYCKDIIEKEIRDFVSGKSK